MSIGSYSNIVTKGLIFSYDMNSKISYKGPALQNKLSGLSATTGTGTGYILTSSTENVNIPGVGDTTVTNCFLQNTGASWCCVNFMNFGNTGSNLSGSTLYTYLILYRVDSGYTHPNFMYRYEYNSSGTYQTESGIFDTAKRVHLGGGWYYAWNTFTTQPTTTNATCYGFSYNYSSYTDKYSYAKVCILQGDYSGLHPKYWPNLGETRSNTQALFDLTGNNTITASSLTHASDGSFSFNGSSNYMDVANNLGTLSRYTISFWAKRDSENRMPVAGRTSTAFYWYGDNSWAYTHGGTWGEYYYSKPTSIPLGTWGHYCVVYDGSYVKIYRQGVFQGQQATTGTADWSQGLRIGYWAGGGGYWWNGKIDSLNMYNVALSDDEVMQNFNAGRGRYSI